MRDIGKTWMTGSTGSDRESVLIRAYAELNDFLPPSVRFREFSYPMSGGNHLKHLVESAGIPHTEIELILLNGRSVGLDTFVEPGDRISVYPVFETLDVTPLVRLRPEPLRRTRFILDVHLGKLAVILRLLGFDALFPGDVSDRELALRSVEENRILLTRDRMLLKRSMVTHGCFVRSRNPEEQAEELLDRLDLRASVRPFTLCARCSGRLVDVKKEEIVHLLEPLTRKYYDEFRSCRDCAGVYWKGSHYQALTELLRRLGVEAP